MDLSHSVTFAIYALFATGLCLLLVSIDSFGGALVPRRKTTLQTDKAGMAATDVVVDGHARVMAAHRNAVANIIPFLVVMLLYLLLGATKNSVIILCSVFAAMRVAHAVTHIRHLQPWRTIVWLVAQLCLFAAMYQVVHAALAIM
jgi:uncharacterized MAPEG superfamily protein